MTEAEAEELGYTHLSKYCGFYCYSRGDEDGMDIQGTNWIRQQMVTLFLWIETNVYSPNEEGFLIEEIYEL